MSDEAKNVKGSASPAPATKTWYIPVFWAGPSNLRVGQPCANADKANGILRSITGDRANAFVVNVELPECTQAEA